MLSQVLAHYVLQYTTLSCMHSHAYLRSAEKSSIGMAKGSRNLYTTFISCEQMQKHACITHVYGKTMQGREGWTNAWAHPVHVDCDLHLIPFN